MGICEKICMGRCVFVNRKVIKRYLTLVFYHGWGNITTDSYFYSLYITTFSVFYNNEEALLYTQKKNTANFNEYAATI